MEKIGCDLVKKWWRYLDEKFEIKTTYLDCNIL
jgi:hypothetical protein